MNSRSRLRSINDFGVCSLLAAAAGTACLAGCSGGGSGPALTTSDFGGSAATPAGSAAEPIAPPAGMASMSAAGPRAGLLDEQARVVTIVPIQLEDAGRLSTSVPAPGNGPAMEGSANTPQATAAGDAATASAAAVEPPLPIDALVGHINGQPVYASEMLSDLRGLMRAEAAKGGGVPAWRRTIKGQIEQKLRARIENELVLAEARESLTEAQRKGLQFVLDEIRGSVVREQGGGSALRAEQRLAAQDLTLEEETAERLETILVSQELRTKVFPLVNISYRDVRLRYQRDFEKYNPPSLAKFLVIRVSKSSEALQQVEARLAAGDSFAVIAAEDFNRYPDDGVVERTFRGAFGEEPLFFGVDSPLDAEAGELLPGQHAGPIDLGNGNVAWVQLEAIEAPEPISLYDVQLVIENELKQERWQREKLRYLNRLRSAGSFTSERLMTDYLTAIGAYQHLPELTE